MKYKKILLVSLLLINFKAQTQDMSINVEPFFINAPTQSQVLDGLSAKTNNMDKSGGVILGWTRFKWKNISISARNEKNGCFIEKIVFSSDVNAFYPKLESAKNNAWNVKFEQFSQDVRLHEQKHINIYQSAWNQLKSEFAYLEGKVFVGTCENAQNQIQQRINVWDAEVKNEHAILDQKEGHMDEGVFKNILGLK